MVSATYKEAYDLHLQFKDEKHSPDGAVCHSPEGRRSLEVKTRPLSAKGSRKSLAGVCILKPFSQEINLNKVEVIPI